MEKRYIVSYKRDNFSFEDCFWTREQAEVYQRIMENKNSGYTDFEIVVR